MPVRLTHKVDVFKKVMQRSVGILLDLWEADGKSNGRKEWSESEVQPGCTSQITGVSEKPRGFLQPAFGGF